jgi:hypothetical protein
MGDIEQLTALAPTWAREALAARKAALFPAPAVPALAQVPATKSGLSAQAIDAIAEAVVTFVKQQPEPVLARLDCPRTGRDKGVSHVRWRGVFKQSDAFLSGELVTHRGSSWVCQRDHTTQTPARPADKEAPEWTLIVKSGEVTR